MADVLRQALGDGVTVLPVPVATPAGGLVRVQSADTVFFDKAYPSGTAACTMLEKMVWKLSPKETRGPPPFKNKPLPTPFAAMVGSMCDGMAAAGFGRLSGSEIAAAVQGAEPARKDAFVAAGEGYVPSLTAGLTAAAREIRDAAVAYDTAAVEEATAAAKAQLGL